MCNARSFRLEDQVIQFLIGLNDNFSMVQTHVLLMEPLPALNRVYSMVLHEESKSVPDSSLTIDSKILVNASIVG